MTIGKKIGAGFGLALAILVAIGLLSYWSTSQLIKTNLSVAHSYEVLTNLDTLLSLLKDAETGQRGYLLTGEDSYLQPYRDAIANLNGTVEQLRELTADNPNQQRRLEEL